MDAQKFFFVGDGLIGIKDERLNIFFKVVHQSCWVRIIRNVARLVRTKDKKAILDALN